MSRRYSLAHLTVLDLSPAEVIRVAAAAGYDSFGLRLHPVRPGESPAPVHGDTPLRRELAGLMRDTGLTMLDVEAFALTAATDFDMVQRSLEAAGFLGASNALVFIDETDMVLAGDLLGRFCALAAPHGISAALEFMPWLGINSLAQARSLVAGCDAPNIRYLLDSTHVNRTHTPLSELADLPAGQLDYAQICDGPLPGPQTLAEIADEARNHRLFPGDGDFALVDFVTALPDDITIAPEIATSRIAARVPGLERAKRALDCSRAIVAASDALRLKKDPREGRS